MRFLWEGVPKFWDNIPDFQDDFYLHTVTLKQGLLELSPPMLYADLK